MRGLEVKLPGGKHHSILNLCSGGAVKAETAKMIAEALEMPATAIFRYETDSRPLSGSTIGGYHTLVSTVLAQAEKEMLIPYNPAAKATPPKAGEHNTNYFQPDEIARIWEALEKEPIKWQTMIHLFWHTQASMLFFNGIDSVSIDHRFGHAHVSTTTDIYSHEAKLHWDQGGGGTNQRLRYVAGSLLLVF